jgi:hypothetical protein
VRRGDLLGGCDTYVSSRQRVSDIARVLVCGLRNRGAVDGVSEVAKGKPGWSVLEGEWF